MKYTPENFGKKAKIYDSESVLQKESADKLVEFVIECIDKSKVNTILDIGCGTGYLTRLLPTHFEHSLITGIDCASGMIDFCKQSLSHIRNVDFVECDANCAIEGKRYDLMVSNFALHWLEDLETFILKARNNSEFVAFAIPTSDSFKDLRESCTRNDISIDLISLPDKSAILNFLDKNNIKYIQKSIAISQGFDCAFDIFKHFKDIGASLYNEDNAIHYRSLKALKNIKCELDYSVLMILIGRDFLI